jgi:hypothetical protein
VIFDPNGATIDAYLAALSLLVARLAGSGQLSPADQERLWRRVRYVDMSGSFGYVTPFPIYYRLGNESLSSIAQRYLDVVLRLDPKLKEAPIQGWNAVAKLGSRAGMVLYALGCQITEAHSLINHPHTWKDRLQHLAVTTSDLGLRKAVEFFLQEYPEWKEVDRQRAKSALENSLDMFTLDEGMMAQYGASKPGFYWQEDVVNKGVTLLLDFRHEQNSDYRRFKMLWFLRSFIDYIKHRGRGRNQSIGLIIDELTSLYNFDVQAGADIFADDLDELISQIARDFGVWVTLSHQEGFQVDKKSHKTLMSMGTQVLGVTSDFEAALARAERFIKIDPLKVKRYERVWMQDMFHNPYVVDYNPVEYGFEEQDRLAAYRFTDLGLFQFLVRPARREGDIRGELVRMSIANLVKGLWEIQDLVPELRRQLAKRDGIRMESVLAESSERQSGKLITDDHPDRDDIPEDPGIGGNWRDDLPD